MSENYLCEEALSGKCKSECSHGILHEFTSAHCDIPINCVYKNKIVKCIKI